MNVEQLTKAMQVIEAYAHDYRGIEMTEDQLKEMLLNFVRDMAKIAGTE